MGFWDKLQIERWDPDNDGIFDVTYSLGNNGKFTQNSNGDFKHYVPVEGNNKYYDNINDMYWKKDGTIYYSLRNAPNNYIKVDNFVNSEGKDVKPLGQLYASDDQLDAVAELINYNNAQNQLDQIEAQRKESESKNTDTDTGSLADIKVPTGTGETSAANDAKYQQKLKDADLRLQNLIASENESTGYDSTPDSTEDSTIYYKYGPDEIDLKYYLHNLGTNLQSYMNSQNWNKGQKEAFRKAYENYKEGLSKQLTDKSGRFSTDDAGILIDSLGMLDGANDHVFIDENGNSYTSLDDIEDKHLRKTAVEFSPNDEVANYFNAVGQAVVGAGKTRKSTEEATDTNFDLNKNGFINYWSSKINPAGGETDLDPYLDLDPVGPDGKRKRTNRTKYLIHELNSYINSINSGKLKFDKTSFKSKDEYVSKIRQAINNLSNGWDSSDPASLQAIGITPDFYTSFMSEAADPLATSEEVEAAKAETDAKNKSNAASDYIATAKKRYDAYAANKSHYSGDHKVTFTSDKSINPDKNPQGSAQIAAQKLNALGYKINLATNSGESVLIATVDNLWEVIKQALREGATEVQTPNGLKPLQDILSIVMPFTSSESGVFQTDPDHPNIKVMNDSEHDFVNGTILCLEGNKLYFDWIGNHKKCSAWQQLKSNFEEHYGETSDPDKPKYSFDKLGGVLRKFAPGGNLDIANMSQEDLQAYVAALQAQGAAAEEGSTEAPTPETPQEQEVSDGFLHDKEFSLGNAIIGNLYKEREEAAKAKGMSYEQYNKKQRKQYGSPDLYNPDNGVWKTEDYVRAGSILTDIVSIALPAIPGAVANVGSTAASALADWLDDSVTGTEMIKNIGMNLGMDVLGLIPVVGDAAGTGGKLLKSVKKIAPKLMYGLTAWGILGTLKNGSNIMESLQKVTSDEKLTVGDWQNIAQAITAIAGINSGVKAGAAKHMAKKKAKVDDAIGLGVRKVDADGNHIGEKQDIILQGKHATEIKKMLAEGKGAADINKYLHNIEGFSQYEVNTNLSSVPISTGLPVGRTTDADGKKHWGVKNPFSVARKVDAFEIFDKHKLRSGYASRTMLNTNRQDAVDSARIFGESDLLTKAEVDALQKEQIEALTADAKTNTDKRQARIKELQEKIDGTKDADGNIVNEGLNQKIKSKENELQVTTNNSQALSQQLNDITSKQHDLNTRVLGKRVYHIDDSSKFSQKKSKITKESEALVPVIEAKTDRIAKIKDAMDALSTSGKSTKKYKNLESELTTLTQERQKLLDEKDSKDAIIKELEAWETDYKKLPQLNTAISASIASEESLRAAIAGYNAELSQLQRVLDKNDPKSILNATSHSKQKLLDLINNGPFYVTYGTNGRREVKDIAKIIEDMHLMRKGGRLSFLAKGGEITKAAHGVQLKSDAGTWYNDVFSNYADEIIKRIKANRDYYKTINDMQTQHHNIYTEAGGNTNTWASTAYQGKDNSVGNYQTRYDAEKFNQLGIVPKFDTRYVYNPNTKRTSGDNNTQKFKSDNLYSSITDDRRVLGRLGDWDNSQIEAFNNKLKENQLEMYLGDGDYYYIRELGQGTPTKSTPSGTSRDLNEIDLGEGRAGGENDPNKNKPTGDDILSKISGTVSKLGDYASPFSYLRYKLLDNANRRNAIYSMNSIKPMLQNPLTDNVLVYSSLPDEAVGQQLYGDAVRHGSHALTSDGQMQMNALKEFHNTGVAQRDAKFQTSTAMYRTTQEKDLEQRRANHKVEHDTAAQNILQEHQTAEDKAKIWSAYKTQAANARDTLLQEIQNKYETAKNERKAREEAAALAEMKAAVENNPNNYGANLTASELAIYNAGRAGKSSSDMSTQEINDYVSAVDKVNTAGRRQQYAYYGIPESVYAKDAYNKPKAGAASTIKLTDLDRQGGILAKDGSKIANIRAKIRMKNADRVQKSIEKKIDNLNKKLDRISKSMSSLPQAKII